MVNGGGISRNRFVPVHPLHMVGCVRWQNDTANLTTVVNTQPTPELHNHQKLNTVKRNAAGVHGYEMTDCARAISVGLAMASTKLRFTLVGLNDPLVDQAVGLHVNVCEKNKQINIPRVVSWGELTRYWQVFENAGLSKSHIFFLFAFHSML